MHDLSLKKTPSAACRNFLSVWTILLVCWTSSFRDTDALNNNFLSKLLPNPTKDTAPIQLRQDPEVLLRDLDIQVSKTTPRLAYARPQQIPALLSAGIAGIVRGGSGVLGCNYQVGLTNKNDTAYTLFTIGNNKQLDETALCKCPAKPLIMYEYESDAECRLVREACSMMSLTVTVYPIPRKGPHYRKQALEEFINCDMATMDDKLPLLYDPNTQIRLIGAIPILDYLFGAYGPGTVPTSLQQPRPPKTREPSNDNKGGSGGGRGGVNWPLLTAAIGLNVARGGAGGKYDVSSFNYESGVPLIMYGYEGSPFCKLVRERLSSLELPHTIYYTPRGSINRQRLFEQTNRFQVPYIQDPNTGVKLFESEAIIEYLNKQYGVPQTPIQWM